jgi:hypothetical protein
MGSWVSRLRADPIDWLLKGENPSIRYWTYMDLLPKRKTKHEPAEIGRQISEGNEISTVFSKTGVNGGVFWSKPDGNIYWGSFSTGSVLMFLAETGLTREDPRIVDLANFLFRYQSSEGFFKLSPKGPGWWSCFTATVLGALIRFGYLDDERVERGIGWLFDTQRLDGGWYCTKNSLRGGPKERLESCPHSVLNVLWAFMVVPELRRQKELIPAVELLLRHWETKTPIPDVDRGRYGIGSRFRWIRYPLFEYHLLKYTYILSHYDHAIRDKRLREAVDLLISKQDDQGRWLIDKPYKGWNGFEFGKKGNPSRWVTLDALRTLKNVYG